MLEHVTARQGEVLTGSENIALFIIKLAAGILGCFRGLIMIRVWFVLDYSFLRC